ncbi:MAG: hypothetical protein ABJE95_39635 [Byssovorax sp.]
MTTPYRDDTDSLEARHTALAEELSSVQAKTKELDELRASEARLAKEVADVQRKLEGRRSRRALPLLESIQIASPCTAKWDEMVGDERARFCKHCEKDVYNLSAMPRDEAESFMRERTSDVCVRLYKRTDGTVLTADCPVGVKRKRRRKAAVAAVGGGLLAAGALLRMASTPVEVDPTSDESHVMGKYESTDDTPAPVAPKVDPTPHMPMGVVRMPDNTTKKPLKVLAPTSPKKSIPGPR